jgi:hypothetical protein
MVVMCTNKIKQINSDTYLYNRSKTFLTKKNNYYESKHVIRDINDNRPIKENNLEINIQDALKEADLVTISLEANDFIEGLSADNYNETRNFRYYQEAVRFALDNAVKYNYNKTMIANLLESHFSYFFEYFNQSYKKNPHLKYIIDLIEKYDEYHKYFNIKKGTSWLHQWTTKREKEYNYKDYKEFLDYLREKNKEAKEKN